MAIEFGVGFGVEQHIHCLGCGVPRDEVSFERARRRAGNFASPVFEVDEPCRQCASLAVELRAGVKLNTT